MCKNKKIRNELDIFDHWPWYIYIYIFIDISLARLKGIMAHGFCALLAGQEWEEKVKESKTSWRQEGQLVMARMWLE